MMEWYFGMRHGINEVRQAHILGNPIQSESLSYASWSGWLSKAEQSKWEPYTLNK